MFSSSMHINRNAFTKVSFRCKREARKHRELKLQSGLSQGGYQWVGDLGTALWLWVPKNSLHRFSNLSVCPFNSSFSRVKVCPWWSIIIVKQDQPSSEQNDSTWQLMVFPEQPATFIELLFALHQARVRLRAKNQQVFVKCITDLSFNLHHDNSEGVFSSPPYRNEETVVLGHPGWFSLPCYFKGWLFIFPSLLLGNFSLHLKQIDCSEGLFFWEKCTDFPLAWSWPLFASTLDHVLGLSAWLATNLHVNWNGSCSSFSSLFHIPIQA